MPSKELRELMTREGGSKGPLSIDNRTKLEKLADFWYYHRLYFIGGLVALAIIIFVVVDLTNNIEPDISINIITERYFPQAAADAIEADFAQHVSDLNGDGQVLVQLNIYNHSTTPGDTSVDPNTQMASVTRFNAEFTQLTSVIYVTDDFNSVQENYGIFADLQDNDIEALSDVLGSVRISDTSLQKKLINFDDEGAAEFYDDFYEEYVIGIRLLPDFPDEEQQIQIDNGHALFESLTGIIL